LFTLYLSLVAEVAELADAHDSKSCGLTPLWVRFPPSALARMIIALIPIQSHLIYILFHFII
jgi:hypothetical protein